MTYFCGIGPGLGMPPREPHIQCNGCSAVKTISKTHIPPMWFMDGKAPPGWKQVRNGDERRDYCPKCKKGVLDAKGG